MLSINIGYVHCNIVPRCCFRITVNILALLLLQSPANVFRVDGVIVMICVPGTYIHYWKGSISASI